MILNQFVNSKRRAAYLPSVMKLGSPQSSVYKVISNLFAECFVSTYSSSTFNAQNYVPEEKNFDVPFVDQRTVSKYTQQLKSSHVAVPDAVPSSILEHHSQLLRTPLTY